MLSTNSANLRHNSFINKNRSLNQISAILEPRTLFLAQQYNQLSGRASNQQQQPIKETTLMKPHTIRLRVKTNKFLDMLVAIEVDKSMRELAHRVLNCYHELADQQCALPPRRRDLTVSALKIDNYYISKTEIVGNLLKDQDQIFCMLSKARPRYPNQPQAYQQSMKKLNRSSLVEGKENQVEMNQRKGQEVEDVRGKSKKQKNRSKRHIKKEKRREKEIEKQASGIFRPEKDNQPEMSSGKKSPFLFGAAKPNKDREQFNEKQISVFEPEPLKINNPELSATFRSNPSQLRVDNMFEIIKNIVPSPNKSPNANLMDKIGRSKQEEKQKKTIQEPPTIARNETPPKIAKEDNPKKNKINSILEMLSKASQDKQKKTRKKDKRSQKVEEQIEPKIQKTPINSKNSQKNEINTAKIASPKVTFHTSPVLSPLNSPLRKLSSQNADKVQKMDLEGTSQTIHKTSKKQSQEKKKNLAQKSDEKASEVKKQVGLAVVPKIIVEQESEAENDTKDKQETTKPCLKHIEAVVNPKVAALDAKISKYRLQLFNDSDDQ